MASSNSDPKITVHWLEVSRAHRVVWLLEELEVPYELKTYKRTKSMTAPPELKAIHPLGKSPVITIETSNRSEPLVLAESGAIVEYLCGYYGKQLIPKRYKDGQDGQIGGETESWLRYRMLMHYAEGSLMLYMVTSLLVNVIRNSPVWFFIRPITTGVADKLTDLFLRPNFETHYKFLEGQLETSPDGGDYFCGKDFTAADIMMAYPLEAGQTRSGMTQEQCPKLWAYVDRLHEREAYKRFIAKIESVEGKFKSNL